MNPLDCTFLHVEDGTNHMHIAACAVFEGPAPSYEELVDAVAAKLPLIPRYRQKVRFVPYDLGRPVWVDDPDFEIEYHLRRLAVPAPGGRREVADVMGWLMSYELDRTRPLWEAWVLEGLEDGRWAVVSKLHHCMVDGVAGVDLLSVLLDHQREPSDPVQDEWDPEPEPSDLRLALDAVVALATSPYEQLRALRRVTRAPGQALRRARDLAAGLLTYAPGLLPNPPTSLSGRIGAERRWTWAEATLADVKEIRCGLGGTVNDVVLAVIAGGFRRLLERRAEDVDHLRIRSLVPVSVRAPDQRGDLHNYVSAIFAELPIAVADPVARLDAIRAQMEALKGSHEVEAGEALTRAARFVPGPLFASAERAAIRLDTRVPQHSINTVTTNVRGPQFPLYAVGREMTDYLPYVPLAHGVRVGVAILSYNGRVAFGVTGDWTTAPDIDVLARGIEADVADLLAVARRRHPVPV